MVHDPDREMSLSGIILSDMEIRVFERAAKRSGKTLDDEICEQVGKTIERLLHLEKLERLSKEPGRITIGISKAA